MSAEKDILSWDFFKHRTKMPIQKYEQYKENMINIKMLLWLSLFHSWALVR